MVKKKCGMFLFSGYFYAIEAMENNKDKWEMLKAIYEYIVNGIEPEDCIKNDSIFCLVKSFHDGLEKKMNKRSVNDKQKAKSNIKAGAKNFSSRNKENCEFDVCNVSEEKVKNKDIKNKNKIKIKNENKIKNKNENKKEIEKEIYKEKEQEKTSSSVYKDNMSFACTEEGERENELTATLRAVSSFDFFDEPIDVYARHVEEAYISNAKTNTTPTKEEVEYFAMKTKAVVPIEIFFNYYEARGWEINGKQIKDWKAVFIKWDKSYRQNTKTADDKSSKNSGLIKYRGKTYTKKEFDDMIFQPLTESAMNELLGEDYEI